MHVVTTCVCVSPEVEHWLPGQCVARGPSKGRAWQWIWVIGLGQSLLFSWGEHGTLRVLAVHPDRCAKETRYSGWRTE